MINYLQLLSDSSLHQSQIWSDFQQSIGRETFYLKEENSHIFITKIPLPKGFCWFWAPRCPVGDQNFEKLWWQIQKLAKKQKAIYIRFENPSQNIEFFFPNIKFKKSPQSYLPETTLILDLTQSEEQILTQMKQKGRYNIRLAEKKGVKIEIFDYQDIAKLKIAVENFHQILKETEDRDGFKGHDGNYYFKMLQSLKSNAKLYLAKYENNYLAGIIITKFKNTATYYYGASSNLHREVMAPYLLQWRAIKDAKKGNCVIYDFLGISPITQISNDNLKSPKGIHNSSFIIHHSPLKNVTQFKLKFGGIEITYPPSKTYIFKPWLYYLLLAAKFLLKKLT